MQISHNYTYTLSLSGLPPLPPFHPSRSSQSARLGSLCYTATSRQLSILHLIVYIPLMATFSIGPTHSLLNCVHKSTLCICLSIPSLHIGSSISFLEIPYICIKILNLFFFFLTCFTLCNRL